MRPQGRSLKKISAGITGSEDKFNIWSRWRKEFLPLGKRNTEPKRGELSNAVLEINFQKRLGTCTSN